MYINNTKISTSSFSPLSLSSLSPPSPSSTTVSAMREENPSWFARWEEEEEKLPRPEDLIPLSQTLITPHLALAFHIHTTPKKNTSSPIRLRSTPPAADYGGDSPEPARTVKRPRLVWTPQLHKRFVEAVAHLGIKNAVPKTIMQLMSVEGLTRENVASHLQKYRLYLRRMQGSSAGGGGHVSDPATDRLFASSAVPAHFLSPPVRSEQHFMRPSSMVPYHQSQIQNGFQRFADLESGNGDGGRRILTLFPTTGDD